MRHDISKNDGVAKKVLDQVTYWKSQGHQVQVFCYVPKKKSSILTANQYPIRTPLKNKLFLEKHLLFDLSLFNPDVVYYRYSTLNRTLAYILKNYKTITEVNSDDIGESKILLKKEKNLKAFTRYSIFTLFRSKVLSKVWGIVTVTREISNLPTIQTYKKPTVYIPNGINLRDYRPLKKLKLSADRVGLFFIGTPNQPWHGVDIIEKLALKLPQYDFHIVGMTGDNSYNLSWHGYLEQNQYIDILSTCHICIGTLALERKQMTEACPLKVREYLAYGYPTIIGYKDTAFLDRDVPFILKIDTNSLNEKTIQDICDFVERNKYYSISTDLIQPICIEKTEDARLAFMQNCISQKKVI